MKSLHLVPVLLSMILLNPAVRADAPSPRALAAARIGGVQGGGGHPDEIPFFAIRQDMLRWLRGGGARALEFNSGHRLATYESEMEQWLEPGVIVINITSESSLLKVEGSDKLCRGFVDAQNERPHILCHPDLIARPAEDQYRTFAHEVHGLAKYENNVGAASDYFYSNQISASLEWDLVKRLAIKPARVEHPVVPGCRIAFQRYDVPRKYRRWQTPAAREQDGRVRLNDRTKIDLEAKGYELSSLKQADIQVSYQMFVSIWRNELMTEDGKMHDVSELDGFLSFYRPKILNRPYTFLSHPASGFRRSLGTVLPAAAALDPRRERLNWELRSAATPAQRMRVQKMIDEAGFQDLPAETVYDAAVRVLPSCKDFYSGR